VKCQPVGTAGNSLFDFNYGHLKGIMQAWPQSWTISRLNCDLQTINF
jgi:hypothetical protein